MDQGLAEHLESLSVIGTFVIGVVVVIIGQVYQRGKTEAGMESKFKSHADHLGAHDAALQENKVCIAALKKRHSDFITEPQHDRIQASCQARIFAEINHSKTDNEALNKKFDSMSSDLGDMKQMIGEVLGQLKSGGQ